MKGKKPTNFRKHLESLSHSRSTREIFDAFVLLSACALSAGAREDEYMAEIKRWKREDLTIFSRALADLILEMEQRPFEDLIGAYYMEFALSSKGQQWNGEFHTPKCLCDLMAQMTVQASDLPKEGVIKVAEPACGAGAMILAFAQAVPPADRRRLRVTATDVNRTACNMTFINTTLWGVPCEVIHGNTLSLEVWNAWKNIHWMMPWLPVLSRSASESPTAAVATAADFQPKQLDLLTA